MLMIFDDIIHNFDPDTQANDISNVIHERIGYQVFHLSNIEHIEILNDYVGGVFEAIELCKGTYGQLNYTNTSKSNFYALLEFHSLQNEVYDKVIKVV